MTQLPTFEAKIDKKIIKFSISTYKIARKNPRLPKTLLDIVCSPISKKI